MGGGWILKDSFGQRFYLRYCKKECLCQTRIKFVITLFWVHCNTGRSLKMEVIPVCMLIAINIVVVHYFDIAAIFHLLSSDRTTSTLWAVWILVFGYRHHSCLGIVPAFLLVLFVLWETHMVSTHRPYYKQLCVIILLPDLRNFQNIPSLLLWKK